MTHEQLAGAADENVCFAPSVRAVEVVQIVEPRAFVDVVWEGAMAIVRSRGSRNIAPSESRDRCCGHATPAAINSRPKLLRDLAGQDNCSGSRATAIRLFVRCGWRGERAGSTNAAEDFSTHPCRASSTWLVGPACRHSSTSRGQTRRLPCYRQRMAA